MELSFPVPGLPGAGFSVLAQVGIYHFKNGKFRFIIFKNPLLASVGGNTDKVVFEFSCHGLSV